jgi:hypothetical protein
MEEAIRYVHSYTYRQCISRISGPIMAVNILGTQIIFLNTPEYVIQILEKRSAITTLRPYLEMSNGL